MRSKLGYLAGGAAAAMLSFVVTLEVQDVTLGPPTAPTGPRFETGPRFDPASINRTLKGDRLPLMQGPSGGAIPAAVPSETENGMARICPPHAGGDMFAPEVAGRCLA
jgi:hypothetical protein